MLFFDLPVTTPDERHDYTAFRKAILKDGFFQVQESVYMRLIRNAATMKQEVRKIHKISPKEGNIRLLPMTLNEVMSMDVVRGEKLDLDWFAKDTLLF